ncbi:MAG TPA: hypothetical protein VGE30_03810 [Candidatus Saccharimonadales bacterium]
MAKRETSIRINGRHYDALTGALLSDTTTHALSPSAAKTPRARSIDGVVKNQATHNPTIIKPQKPETKLTTEPVIRASRPPKTATKRATAQHAKAKQVRPSATLMRHAVKKPQTASLKRQVKVQSSTLATTKSMHPVRIAQKTSVHSVNHQRLTRANQTSLHPMISRFAQEVAQVVPTATEQAMTAINKAIVIPQTVAPQHVVYRPDVMSAKRRPAPTTSDIFEQALQRATSHEQAAPVSTPSKNRRPGKALRQRMMSYSAGAVAVLALVGFFGMQHADTIQFKVASNRAGFAATMPSYQPAGFNMDSVRTYNGYVGLKYVADTIEGQRSYAITEKPSSWNSSALLSYITEDGKTSSYRVVEKAGRTVYVYGNNQAAWVSGGILYQLVSTSELGNHEIGQIAASM